MKELDVGSEGTITMKFVAMSGDEPAPVEWWECRKDKKAAPSLKKSGKEPLNLEYAQ